jgi:nucleoside-diphosphate-sugar epimerase
MKILFIGGTGNISSECTAYLHRQGHQVIVLTRGNCLVPPEYQAIRGDRRDQAGLRAALADVIPEVVINFLGFEVSDLQIDFDLFRENIRQYIFISSATVYAKPPRRLPLTEDAPQGNIYWEYARKKQACEEWLLERFSRDCFPVTMVRPSHTYSKRWIPNPVSSSSYTFAARLEQGLPVWVPDDGENPWTLTAATDFAVGLAGLVGNPKAIGEAFHITSDEVLTWNQIVGEIALALGVTSPVIHCVPTDLICQVLPRMVGTLKGDKAQPGVFDNAKIKRFVPGFQCRQSFRSGVRASVDWLRGHPEDQHLSPRVNAEIEAVISAKNNEFLRG